MAATVHIDHDTSLLLPLDLLDLISKDHMVYSVRDAVNAPDLSSVSAVALLPLAWGLWNLEVWPTLFGTVMIYAGKVWFLDRMVWLYEDTRD